MTLWYEVFLKGKYRRVFFPSIILREEQKKVNSSQLYNVDISLPLLLIYHIITKINFASKVKAKLTAGSNIGGKRSEQYTYHHQIHCIRHHPQSFLCSHHRHHHPHSLLEHKTDENVFLNKHVKCLSQLTQEIKNKNHKPKCKSHSILIFQPFTSPTKVSSSAKIPSTAAEVSTAHEVAWATPTTYKIFHLNYINWKPVTQNSYAQLQLTSLRASSLHLLFRECFFHFTVVSINSMVFLNYRK